MKFPNKTESWTISLLTPLHVGDGNALEAGMDFIEQHGQLEVIDSEETFRQLQDNPYALKELGHERFNWGNFTRQYGIRLFTSYSMGVKGADKPQRVRSFIKDGFARPYLPGSSLKGSLRTAFLAKMVSLSNVKPYMGKSKKRADDYLDKLAGGNPQHDFLRGFHVSDSLSVEIPKVGIMAREIKYFNLQSPDKAGWKNFSNRRTIDSYREAVGVFVETLEPGVNLTVCVSLDGSLSDPDQRDKAGLPAFSQVQDFESMCSLINEQSLKMALSEKEFFSAYSSPGKAAAGFYQNLYEKIKELSPRQGFIARLAWGSGWKGMTGDWMDESMLRDARQKFFKRSNLDMPFPKTRRLAIDEHGIPSLPLGWIKVSRQSENVFQKESSAIASLSMVKHAEQQADLLVAESTQQATPSKSPEELREETLSEFRSIVNQAGPGLSGSIDEYINRINIQEDRQLQKDMGTCLLNAAKSLGKSYKNARKNNKQWIQKLDEVLKSTGVQ